LTGELAKGADSMKHLTIVFLSILASTVASAEVSLVLHESLGEGGSWTRGGHVSLYFSNLCAETPVKVRACREGETKGVHISRYDGISEIPYDWVAVPDIPFLYGVENENEIPLVVTKQAEFLLKKRYYDKHLSAFLPRKTGEKNPLVGPWTQTLGATNRRQIYMLTFKSTPKDDANVVRRLNSEPNKSDFDYVRRNCSHFVESLLHEYFPERFRKENRRFKAMSPKRAAFYLATALRTRPELEYRVSRLTQNPGSYKLSETNLYPSEILYKNRKFAIPLLILKPFVVPAAWLYNNLFRRFELFGEYMGFFNAEISAVSIQQMELRRQQDSKTAEVDRLSSEGGQKMIEALTEKGLAYSRLQKLFEIKKSLQIKLVGEESQWAEMKRTFVAAVEAAIQSSLLPENKIMDRLIPLFEKEGSFRLADDGLEMTLRWNGEEMTTGMSRGNARRGDPRLAFLVATARIFAHFAKKEDHRPGIDEFLEDWALFQDSAIKLNLL
jgi:hypothetical protein